MEMQFLVSLLCLTNTHLCASTCTCTLCIWSMFSERLTSCILFFKYSVINISLILSAGKSAGEGEQQGTSCQINPRIFRCGRKYKTDEFIIQPLTYQVTLL